MCGAAIIAAGLPLGRSSFKGSLTLFAYFGIALAAAGAGAGNALAGGAIGGRVAGRMRPAVLRWTVVMGGFALSLYYWLK